MLCYRLSVVILLCCYLCCSVILVLFYVLIVCTVTLPPGVNPIAVDKYIYIYMFTTACHLTLSWARLIQSMPLHCVSLKCILILAPQWHPSILSGLLWYSHQNTVCISLFPYTCLIPHTSYSSWFDHPYYWWAVQIWMLIIMQLSPLSFYLLPLRIEKNRIIFGSSPSGRDAALP